MSSVNKVILVGRCTKDPETKYMSNSDAVTNLTLATSETWKKDGEKQEKTEFHRVTFYRKLAEIAGEYLKKGSLIYIDGKLSTRKFTDKNGVEKYVTEIIADEMKMLGSKPSGETREKSQPVSQQQSKPSVSGFDDMEDDIPW